MESAKSQFDKNFLTKEAYVTFNVSTKLWPSVCQMVSQHCEYCIGHGETHVQQFL